MYQRTFGLFISMCFRAILPPSLSFSQYSHSPLFLCICPFMLFNRLLFPPFSSLTLLCIDLCSAVESSRVSAEFTICSTLAFIPSKKKTLPDQFSRSLSLPFYRIFSSAKCLSFLQGLTTAIKRLYLQECKGLSMVEICVLLSMCRTDFLRADESMEQPSSRAMNDATRASWHMKGQYAPLPVSWHSPGE